MKKFKIEIKWAFVFAAMMLLWMLLEKLTGLHDVHIDKHMIYTNFVAIPAILIYVFALLDKRKNFYDGKMSYNQGFLSGAIITAIYALLSPLVQLITSYVITPDYFNNVTTYVVENGQMTYNEAINYFNIKNYIIQSFIFSIIMGVITTLIVSIFVRKK